MQIVHFNNISLRFIVFWVILGSISGMDEALLL